MPEHANGDIDVLSASLLVSAPGQHPLHMLVTVKSYIRHQRGLAHVLEEVFLHVFAPSADTPPRLLAKRRHRWQVQIRALSKLLPVVVRLHGLRPWAANFMKRSDLFSCASWWARFHRILEHLGYDALAALGPASLSCAATVDKMSHHL